MWNTNTITFQRLSPTLKAERLRIIFSLAVQSSVWGSWEGGPRKCVQSKMGVVPLLWESGKTWKREGFEEGFPWIWEVREKKDIRGRSYRFYTHKRRWKHHRTLLSFLFCTPKEWRHYLRNLHFTIPTEESTQDLRNLISHQTSFLHTAVIAGLAENKI